MSWHVAKMLPGVYSAGVLSGKDQGYNTEPGSWSHSHVVVYPNGKVVSVSRKEPTAEELAEELLGTCETIPEWALESGDKFLNDFDNRIFQCICCGWWSDKSEVQEDDDGEQIWGGCAE